MSIPIVCPHGHEFNVPEQYLGKSVRCPKCQASSLVEWPVELSVADADDPLSPHLLDPLLAAPMSSFPTQASTYTPNAARPAAKQQAQPHWLETTAGKATSVGGGVALGSLLALMLLGVISLFRGSSASSGNTTGGNVAASTSVDTQGLTGDELAKAMAVGRGKIDVPDQVQIAAYGLLAHEQLFRSYAPKPSERPGGQLGWRVHILPLIGEDELYKQFNFNEPWNSPANSKLLTKIPDCFNTGDGPKTRIRSTALLVGPTGAGRGQDIPDTSEATLLTLCVPKSMATEWTKPEDLEVSPQLVNKILAEQKNDILFGVTCTGQPVKFMAKVAEQHLLGMLTTSGGEKISIEKLIAEDQLAVPHNQERIAPIGKLLRNSAEQSSNIKTLVLGMQYYSDTYKALPPAKNRLSADGQELLSWRVHILPFIDKKDLYDKFKLDEPWDSPNNLPLLDQMPSIFAEPGATTTSTDTTIMKVRGPGTIYATPDGPPSRKVKDGGLTVLLYTTGPENKIPWTKPDVLQVDPENIHSVLAARKNGFIYCAMLDGRVSTIKTILPAEQFKAIFSADGQETLPDWMADYGGVW